MSAKEKLKRIDEVLSNMEETLFKTKFSNDTDLADSLRELAIERIKEILGE